MNKIVTSRLSFSIRNRKQNELSILQNGRLRYFLALRILSSAFDEFPVIVDKNSSSV